MKQQLLAVAFSVVGSATLMAQAPGGSYYQGADGLKGEALKTKLSAIISVKKHSPSYDELIDLYKKTDTRADGYVRDWYSNISNFTHVKDKAGSYSKEGDVYNREHTVPQSWGSPKADIVHVVPTDGYVNNRRGNLPFGEVGNISWQSANGYSKLGTSKTPGYSSTVFEPNDEVKGDIARIYFYMATCYESSITSWNGGGVITGTKYQPYAQWTFDMMMRWSQLDPVDNVERARNEAISDKDVQGNRNPFVDYPGLEDYIWGSKKNVAFSYDNYEGGEVVILDRVDQPVFSPSGGTFTDRVEVTVTTATEGASIYYTTNGAEPSTSSSLYTAPIVLTQTSTLKAIAVKSGMSTSYQTSADFTIKQSSVTPVDGAIALNNTLFGTSFDGSLTGTDLCDYSATQNGVTVVYAKGSGSNMYLNDSQLRLYQGNTLTLSVGEGTITEAVFTVVKNQGNKTMLASEGQVNDFIWTGDAQSVTFSINSGSGHLQLSHVKVNTTNGMAGIESVGEEPVQWPFRSLSGARVDSGRLHPGIYIQKGKKIIVR